MRDRISRKDESQAHSRIDSRVDKQCGEMSSVLSKGADIRQSRERSTRNLLNKAGDNNSTLFGLIIMETLSRATMVDPAVCARASKMSHVKVMQIWLAVPM